MSTQLWNLLAAPELATIIRDGGERAVPYWVDRRHERMREAMAVLKQSRAKETPPPIPAEPPPVRRITRQIVRVHSRPGRLTAEIVMRIRERHATAGRRRGMAYGSGLTMLQIGREFGITEQHVSYIVNRRQWKEIA